MIWLLPESCAACLCFTLVYEKAPERTPWREGGWDVRREGEGEGDPPPVAALAPAPTWLSTAWEMLSQNRPVEPFPNPDPQKLWEIIKRLFLAAKFGACLSPSNEHLRRVCVCVCVCVLAGSTLRQHQHYYETHINLILNTLKRTCTIQGLK